MSRQHFTEWWRLTLDDVPAYLTGESFSFEPQTLIFLCGMMWSLSLYPFAAENPHLHGRGHWGNRRVG